MTRDEFDARATQLIRRNWRLLDDAGGTPPPALLDGLHALAEQHAAEAERENLREWREGPVKREDDAPTAEQVATWIRDNPAELAKMARVAGGMDKLMAIGAGTAAPRRTTRRSTPK